MKKILSSVKVILSLSEPSDYQDGLTPNAVLFAVGNFLKTGIYLHSVENLNLEGLRQMRCNQSSHHELW